MSAVQNFYQHVCCDDHIDEHPTVVAEFLDIFGTDIQGARMSDHTELRDFTGYWGNSGATSSSAAAGRRSRAQWDSWVLTTFRSRFGFTPRHGLDSNVSLLIKEIVAHRASAKMH
jgi:hypothetical protein